MSTAKQKTTLVISHLCGGKVWRTNKEKKGKERFDCEQSAACGDEVQERNLRKIKDVREDFC